MSPSAAHTFGQSCRLAPVTPMQGREELQGIPPLHAQFFYASPVALDDPLSTATIVGVTDSKTHNAPLRPFVPGDNNALERAWLALGAESCRRTHTRARRERGLSPSLSQENAEKLDVVIDKLAVKHRIKHEREGRGAAVVPGQLVARPDSAVPACCAELMIDASAELRNEFCGLVRRHERFLNHDSVIERVMSKLAGITPVAAQGEVAAGSAKQIAPSTTSKVSISQPYKVDQGTSGRSGTAPVAVTGAIPHPEASLESVDGSKVVSVRPAGHEDGISGTPFVRIDTESTPQASAVGSLPRYSPLVEDRALPKPVDNVGLPRSARLNDSDAMAHAGRQGDTVTEESTDILVGVSRLYKVALPVLQMKPIYWSPVGDISVVMRSTWFYKDGMVPILPAVANQLEAGYRELRAWSDTWADELRSALDVGALGEEKISHPLWPETSNLRSNAKDTSTPEPAISSDPFCAARCYQGEAAAAGTLEAVSLGDSVPAEAVPYQNYHVIYKDRDSAFLLKPSLKPSAYYGRKPVARIMKGLTVGVPVVRGFDWQAWDSLYGKKHAPSERSRDTGRGQAAHDSGRKPCPGCELEQQRGQVTDLVLVAHGIGQKFAERVESFHFTHAITAFRRAVNVELRNEAVHSVLRPGQNGIMVLPVNWRHVLKFEEGGPMRDEDLASQATNNFTLKDIEPNTIPAVRSIISDVMFDIPFYMSHHKPRILAALVAEANRVYRLWCQNNPGFSRNGRVHLIAHSLGSAMALEILSKQPTTIPRLDLTRGSPRSDRFEFDTKNLFLLGSPAGFFLLLERGNLVPRRGRLKPDADRAAVADDDVVGDAGTFGCLAVDNIYNILAKEDPIAYLLNGTIDARYGSSLKTAYVPSSTSSLLQSIGNAVRGLAGNTTQASSSPGTSIKKPPTARLPSQLELEVHDFTREDIAEKKAYLLNDNGQIDYYLKSGGGPLEIEYVNVMFAHTSYWNHPDLIRMLCIEIARQPGRKSTRPDMRAVKVAKQPLLPSGGGQ